MTVSRVLRVLLVTALCGVMVALVAWQPTGVQKGGPIVRSGAVGEDVRGDTLRAKVSRVEIGTEVTQSNLAEPERAVGTVFVVVTGTVASSAKSTHMYAQIYGADGSQFEAYDGGSISTMTFGVEFHPGVPVSGALVFEIPADQVAGAKVAVQTKPFDFPEALAEQVRVDLGLDDDDVQRRLATAKRPIQVPEEKTG